MEKELDRKTKPRYLGPYVVVRRTEGGSYVVSELDGAVSRLKVAAFRLIPYFPRSKISVPLKSLWREDDEEPKMMTEDESGGTELDSDTEG